jgi:hypothetical protein
MKVFWWQGGLHIEPESDEDRHVLSVLAQCVKLSTLVGSHGTQVVSGASGSATSAAQKSISDRSIRAEREK